MRSMIIYPSKEALIAEIQSDLDAGLNVYLYTDCSNNARQSEFDQLLAALTPRAKSVKRLDKAGFADPSNKDYLSDLTNNITEQLVICSPAMNSGVSIESDHFDSVYVLGRGTTLPTELIQAPPRVRKMKEVRIYIDAHKYNNGLSINPDFVLEEELLKESSAGYEVTPDFKQEMLAKPGVADVIDQIVYENGMRANYANTFYHIAMLHNYVLSYSDKIATEEEEKEISAAKARAEAQRIAQVAAEEEIDAATAKKIIEKDAMSRAEECKLYKYQL
ncbi:hypothetical protein, partial [Allohahella marinimesophila]|uniref:hypothetical protein n=1 Tax=Allohahella marinimesophila TaxID=1054972 RepID=UPI0031E40E89